MRKVELYFDGVCNTCNWLVDFLLRHDPEDVFRFASLQSDYAKAHLPIESSRLDTLVVRSQQGQILTESDGFLEIVRHLDFPYRALVMIKWIPKPLRDFCYRLFAKNRYRFFGKSESCRLPTESEIKKFLT